MNWFYAEGGVQKGPVPAGELLELRRSGQLDGETLVWCEGMENWRPMKEAPGLEPPPGHGACSECGGVFADHDLMQFEKSRICARCKPIFLQRLREGVSNDSACLWRDGRKLVALDGHSFPTRCVKCGAPASGALLKRKLYWHHPLLYLLLLVSVLIYVIVALIVRKRAQVHVGLCSRHRSRRAAFVGVAWVLFVVCVVLFWISVAQGSAVIALNGILLLLVAACIGNFGGRVVYASRIKDKHVWLGGVGQAFLRDLQEWRA